jgi:mRNA export factor
MSGIFGTSATSAATASNQTQGDLKGDVELSNPPEDSITDLSFSPAPNGPDLLAVSSWDSKVRIYEINSSGQSQGRHAYTHGQPIFSCDFSKVSCSLCLLLFVWLCPEHQVRCA